MAELAHGEKSHIHSITHPPYLMPQEPKYLCFGTAYAKLSVACLKIDICVCQFAILKNRNRYRTV